MSQKPQSKFIMISLMVVLMIAVVVILGQALQQINEDPLKKGLSTSQSNGIVQTPTTAIKSEREPFRSNVQTSRLPGLEKGSRRSLASYYARRAYPGAPPSIPHPNMATMEDAFQSCLGCHEKGGFSPPLNAYAPITPHPELVSCRQCHVAQVSQDLFQATQWQSIAPAPLGRSALPGAPPPIPHDLQMRENCSACHSGPAAPRAIRTSHPERQSCRQCHMAKTTDELFSR